MNIFGLNIKTAKRGADVNNDSAFTGSPYWSSDASLMSSTSPDSATRSGAVYSCVDRIASGIASMPLILYRRLPGGGKERATDHPLYRTLNFYPNLRNTRMEFIEALLCHLLLRGNAYVKISMQKDGRLLLDILSPDYIRVVPRSDGSLAYVYIQNGKVVTWEEYEICHVRMWSLDGVTGRGPIQVARETVFRAVTLETFHTQTYKNGIKPSGTLEHPRTLNKEVAERISESFRKAYSGAQNAGKVPLLEEGMKFNPFQMSLEDAQFIEGRKLTRSEVAGIFNVPAHMIGDLDHATFSNIENLATQFVMFCLRPYLVRIEQSLQRSLLGEDEQDEYFIEFLADAILRGDTMSRYLGYQLGLMNGITKFNEPREKENQNPLPWGDATMVPLNARIIRSAKDLDQPPPAAPAAKDSGKEPPPEPGADKAKNSTRAAVEMSFRLSLFRFLESIVGRSHVSIISRRVEVLSTDFAKHYCAAGAVDGRDLRGVPDITATVALWTERTFDGAKTKPDCAMAANQLVTEVVELLEREAFHNG